MKKVFPFVLFWVLVAIHTRAQPDSYRSETLPAKGKSQQASFIAHLPMGYFARSHIAGAGLNYSWSHHRFGIVAPKKWMGLTFSAGGDYYLGKKVKTAGYGFTYGGYTYAYVLAGLIANPWANSNITLTAGPAMGIYKGNSNVGWTINLFGSYYLDEKISIGPGVTYRGEAQTDALWSIAVKASYSF